MHREHLVPVGSMLVLFTVSRIWGWESGVRFDATTVETFWQILDPTLLKEHLLQSIWYLHGQPPLYNLLLGVDLKVFGPHFATVAHGAQVAIGVAIGISLYVLLFVNGVSRWWAAAVASLLVVSPAMLIYENWLFYEYLVAVLLLLTTLAFVGFQRRPTTGRSFAIFAALAVLCYVRSSFQIVLLLAVLGLMLILFPEQRRIILIGAAIPFVLVVGLYLKNWALFGTPSTSSWTGMNLMQVALNGLSDHDRQVLGGRRVLSPVSLAGTFQPLAAYQGLLPAARPRGIPVLDETTKPASGAPNLNNIEYVAISQRQLHDFLRLLVNDPAPYLDGVGTGLELAGTPSDEYWDADTNRAHIATWAHVFDTGVLWQPRLYAADGQTYGTAWGIVVGYLAALIFGAVEFVRAIRRRGGSATLAFVWLLLAYVAFVVTFGEVAENQRIRFSVDPLAIILVSALGARVVSRVRRAPGDIV